MHIHKLLMGSRWKELPAETVLDEKVSKIVGTGVIVLLVGCIGLTHYVTYLKKEIIIYKNQ